MPDALVASLAKDPRRVFDAAWSSDGGRLSITRARTQPPARADRDDVVHELWEVATGRLVSGAASAEEKREPRFVIEERVGSVGVVRQSEAAVVEMGIEQATWGQVRVANELAKQGSRSLLRASARSGSATTWRT